MELILSIIHNPAIMAVIGIVISALIAWLFKKKIDAKKITAFITAIVEAIVAVAASGKTGAEAHNEVAMKLPEPPKSVVKALGKDPIQSVYNEIKKEAKKNNQHADTSSALTQLATGAGKTALSLLVTGLVGGLLKRK